MKVKLTTSHIGNNDPSAFYDASDPWIIEF